MFIQQFNFIGDGFQQWWMSAIGASLVEPILHGLCSPVPQAQDPWGNQKSLSQINRPGLCRQTTHHGKNRCSDTG
jgi:hypothetical protein